MADAVARNDDLTASVLDDLVVVADDDAAQDQDCCCGSVEPSHVRGFRCADSARLNAYALNSWPGTGNCGWAYLDGFCYVFYRDDVQVVPPTGARIVVPQAGDCCTCASNTATSCVTSAPPPPGSNSTARCCCGRTSGLGGSLTCEYRIVAWTRNVLSDFGLGQFGDPYFTSRVDTLLAPSPWTRVMGARFSLPSTTMQVSVVTTGNNVQGIPFSFSNTETRATFNVSCNTFCENFGAGPACWVSQVPEQAFTAWRVGPNQDPPADLATPCMQSFSIARTKVVTQGGTTTTTSESVTVEFRCSETDLSCTYCRPSGQFAILGEAGDAMAAVLASASSPEDIL